MHKTPVRIKHRATRTAHEALDLYDRLEHLRDSLSRIAGNASDQTTYLLSKSFRSAKGQTKNLQRGVNRFVTKKPYKTLGITAAICLCVGYLIHR